MNKKKTEFIVITKDEIPKTSIRIGTERIKQTDSFNYLGCTVVNK